MKWVKIIVPGAIIAFVVYFAVFRTNDLDLEGHWSARSIIIDGKQILPREIGKFIIVEKQVFISGWSHEISLPDDITAGYVLSKNPNGSYQIRLSSKEKSLNGIFQMELDTLNLETNLLQVDVRIKSKNTSIHFNREIDITPPKARLPKKGAV